MTKEVKLKIIEILQLEAELYGVSTQDGRSAFKGLLSTKLKLVAKYWVNELAETVSKEKKKIDDLRLELVKKYGREDDKGSYVIDRFVDEEKTQENPKHAEFQEEYVALLEEEKTLSITPVKLEHLDTVESDENYPIFFRFVQP